MNILILDFAVFRRVDYAEPVPMWVVYSRPLDMPDVPYVARRWKIHADERGGQPTEEHVRCGSLEAARRVCKMALSPGAVRFERVPEDDPVIVESWL